MRPVLHFATALWLGAASAALTDTPLPDADALVLAREPAPLGWATMEGGTTGGARAGEGAIHVVSDRASLIAALGGDNASNATNDIPAIIFLSGTIDLAADESGRSLTAADFADPAYDRDAYIAAYDPATYGRDKEPEGPLEEARARSQEAQAAHTVIHIGSNKTLFGLGDARILNGTLDISGVDNVIVRNITFEDSYDMFPMWDGTDGAEGNWNSEYDLIAIKGSTHVWIDHSAFSDGVRPDDTSGEIFGKLVQHHDGLVDITNGADLVTLTANRFFDHDKTHLIGSSDKREEDRGHLRVTLAGNWYDNLRQRLPRVRFGRVHVFGNLYTPSASASRAGFWRKTTFSSCPQASIRPGSSAPSRARRCRLRGLSSMIWRRILSTSTTLPTRTSPCPITSTGRRPTTMICPTPGPSPMWCAWRPNRGCSTERRSGPAPATATGEAPWDLAGTGLNAERSRSPWR